MTGERSRPARPPRRPAYRKTPDPGSLLAAVFTVASPVGKEGAMLFEQQITEWVGRVRACAELSLRVVLWNGRHYDFGDFAAPAVALHVKSLDALPYLLEPSLDNLGEAYVKGMIDLDGTPADIIATGFALARHSLPATGRFARVVRCFLHTPTTDREAIRRHYDVSNAFYALWLDPAMVYSCAYFECGDEDLHSAQLKKIDHILAKIRLRPGQRLLDIGCGWGALVLRAAQEYGARCVGITLSEKQFEFARERVRAAGLGDRVAILLEDYREVAGRYDRITSVGMFEHVGREKLPAYFARMRTLLADDGVAMNHGITTTDADDGGFGFGGGEFIDRYVFPDGELPHVGRVLRAMQEGGLEAVDMENLRRHYARTLTLWADNFERSSEAVRREVDEKTFRIWRLYLAGCAYAFAQDHISVYQIVCRKAGRAADTLDWSRRYMYA
jgi:cyclopropane-fatty-acyl-phospholipid synthase